MMPKLRIFIITSRVTFVPENYDSVVLGLADHPDVAGLIIIDNLSFTRFKESFLLTLAGAKKLGLQMLKNIFSNSQKRRFQKFQNLNKKVFLVKNLNDPKILKTLADEQIDVLVNLRTRIIYGKDLLTIPKKGCINIHHGILPHQRGVMCDLWALKAGEPAGFSIHLMTSKVDAGVLLHVEESSRNEKNFLAHLRRAQDIELFALKKTLTDISATGEIRGLENIRGEKTRYFKNPTWKDLRAMLKQGMSL